MIGTLRHIFKHPLSAKSPGAALGRYIKWQLGTRILKHPVVVPFVNDTNLVVERGMTGATGNIYFGLHEFVDMAFVLHLLRQEDTFVDVGANVGTYTMLASSVVGATSISMEPVEKTHAQLERNIRINRIEHLVTTHCCGAGEKPDTLYFCTSEGPENRVVDSNYPGPKAKLEVRPLDHVLADKSTYLWKVDVEGFELPVLHGGRRALDSAPAAVILEGDSPAIREFMESMGFAFFRYNPFDRCLTMDERFSSTNHIWVRDKDAVTTRCASAPRFTVGNQSI